MKQYHELLKAIKEKGTLKSAAREGMPGTISLFGYQMRFNLQEGFPLVTTKKVSFKNIVVELLWFLKGDTNIKYLVDNSCNIWNEDAYNYYLKKCKEQNIADIILFEDFVLHISNNTNSPRKLPENYALGDCGNIYGWLWRNYGKHERKDLGKVPINSEGDINRQFKDAEVIFGYNGTNVVNSTEVKLELVYRNNQGIDQLKELIEGLKTNPMGRRHIITAWNPATLDDMALNACHAFVQFNCKPIPHEVKLKMAMNNPNVPMENLQIYEAATGNPNYGPIPQYYLDCQLYQRSADVVLGVPYNIASYALLTEILCKICNMIPGEFVHTFGDVHIYENHLPAVEEQLQREPLALPKLNINTEFWKTETGECGIGNLDPYTFLSGLNSPDFINCLFEDIQLLDYKHQGKLVNETKLFTGLEI